MSDKLIRKYIHGREADLEAEVATLRAQLAEVSQRFANLQLSYDTALTDAEEAQAKLATIEQIAQGLAAELRPYRRGQLSVALAKFDAYQRQKGK